MLEFTPRGEKRAASYEYDTQGNAINHYNSSQQPDTSCPNTVSSVSFFSEREFRDVWKIVEHNYFSQADHTDGSWVHIRQVESLCRKVAEQMAGLGEQEHKDRVSILERSHSETVAGYQQKIRQEERVLSEHALAATQWCTFATQKAVLCIDNEKSYKTSLEKLQASEKQLQSQLQQEGQCHTNLLYMLKCELESARSTLRQEQENLWQQIDRLKQQHASVRKELEVLQQEHTTAHKNLSSLQAKPEAVNGMSLEQMHATVEVLQAAVKNLQKAAVDKRVQTEVQQALQQKEDEVLCVVCMNACKNVVFDCRHMVSCQQCAQRLTSCPVCRSSITTRTMVHS